MQPSHKCSILAGVLLLGVQLGCLGPRRDDYRSTQPINVTGRSANADQLWSAVRDTLRDHRFRLDRVDRRAGVVTTYRTTSQQFFEVWRHDVDTWPDLWDATLNPVARRVEVAIAGEEESATWRDISVVVYKERLSAPDRQFNSTVALYDFFSYRLPSTTGIEVIDPSDEIWIPQGRDAAMEERLLLTILGNAGIDVGDAAH